MADDVGACAPGKGRGGRSPASAAASTAGGLMGSMVRAHVGLPGGMNGRQVADAARSMRPALKVLFITGYAEGAIVGNYRLDPSMQVLTKPFAIDELNSRVKALMAASNEIDRDVSPKCLLL